MENYTNKFKFLSEYDVSKGGQLLEEQLVPANMNDLDIALQQDNNLKILLNTPGKDLPEKYKYLVDEISNYEDYTLLDIIVNTLKYKQFVPYFSKVGNKFTGFAAYQISSNGEEVDNIKMFSFDLSQPATVLLRNLDDLLGNLVQKYRKVAWTAMKENEINAAYQKVIKKYNGNMKEIRNGINYYWIDNTNYYQT